LSIANFSNSPVHFSTGIEAGRKCFRCIPVPRFLRRLLKNAFRKIYFAALSSVERTGKIPREARRDMNGPRPAAATPYNFARWHAPRGGRRSSPLAGDQWG
jgi:hypothetical protein